MGFYRNNTTVFFHLSYKFEKTKVGISYVINPSVEDKFKSENKLLSLLGTRMVNITEGVKIFKDLETQQNSYCSILFIQLPCSDHNIEGVIRFYLQESKFFDDDLKDKQFSMQSVFNKQFGHPVYLIIFDKNQKKFLDNKISS